MEIFNNLVTGFEIALTPINLLYCFLGSFIGTAIGVLPGLGPPATIALLLPVTYGIPATSAVRVPEPVEREKRVYRYTDESGSVNYVDDLNSVPERYRARAEVIP